MDPISAFSLAVNILQIVDTSAKVLVKAAECYNHGAAEETMQLSGNMQLLESLSLELMKTELSSPDRLSAAQLRLREANERCLQLSEKLIGLLKSLRVNEKSVWQAISRSLKTMRYRDTIAELREGVSDSRANLNLALLLLMHERASGEQVITMKTHTDTEARILNSFNQQSTVLGVEIQRLSSKIEGLSLDRSEDTLQDFRSEHEIQLHRLSERVVEILEQQRFAASSQKTLVNSDQAIAAQQRVLQSLYFPQMEERKGQISEVYKGTYSWMFHENSDSPDGKENFISWLSAPSTKQSLFWVSGKPGSGKSALMRYVDQKLETSKGLLPWEESTEVIKASYFLWKSGENVQRSLDFLLRSLLYQVLDQVPPDQASSTVTSARWRSAMSPELRQPEWKLPELKQALLSFATENASGLLILIDGLDELEDTRGRHEELVQLIQTLSSLDTVKICCSSRPDNIFRDAFRCCPQLRLQDLTSNDIQVFVRGQFAKQPRLWSLDDRGDKPIVTLFHNIVAASSGVFLWVCLVVAELLEEARDGASVAELIETVDKVPYDLDEYFSRIIGSIEPRHRAESSLMFQIALHEETEFVTLHSLRLLDLSFVEERHSDFAIRPGYSRTKYDFSTKGLRTRLDSAFRRVNSRCRGLLEMQYSKGNTEGMIEVGCFQKIQEEQENGPTKSQLIVAYDFHVSFLHRSFHDYLLEPRNMEWLQQQPNGVFDARLFLCNARLVQLLSLDYQGRAYHASMALGLASYIVTALSVEDLKRSEACAVIAARIRPVVESLAQMGVQGLTSIPWYLSSELQTYDLNHDNFMMIAIEFELVGYLKAHLTRDAIRAKMGRPLLDKVLRGSEWKGYEGKDVGVSVEILHLLLDLGADPNETWHEISGWARFLLLLLHDNLEVADDTRRRSYLEAVRILLEHDADPVLPAHWFPEYMYKTLDAGPSSDPNDYSTGPGFGMLDGMDAGAPVACILEMLPDVFTVQTGKKLDECILLAKSKAALKH
ncbi:hypothetical protein PG989_016578 [Apiospora arundinis]|uniref:NACHT domain-containing protein n=1 Tax=Apiospora arundinis TaxID=335852 RepID=A0ABR2JFR6_9PEZI